MTVELLSKLLRHRRTVILGALAAVVAAAWPYLLLGGGIEMERDKVVDNTIPLGLFWMMKGGMLLVAPCSPATTISGLIAGLEPATRGWTWQLAQLFEVNRGPRPRAFNTPGGASFTVPDTEMTCRNRFRAANRNESSRAGPSKGPPTFMSPRTLDPGGGARLRLPRPEARKLLRWCAFSCRGAVRIGNEIVHDERNKTQQRWHDLGLDEAATVTDGDQRAAWYRRQWREDAVRGSDAQGLDADGGDRYGDSSVV